MQCNRTAWALVAALATCSLLVAHAADAAAADSTAVPAKNMDRRLLGTPPRALQQDVNPTIAVKKPAVVKVQASSLICDGKQHEITIPEAPFPTEVPYNDPYNNVGGITCGRSKLGSTCGAQEHILCNPWSENNGPVQFINFNGDGTKRLPPDNPLLFTMDKDKYLTSVAWRAWDIGTAGAFMRGVYPQNSGYESEVMNYTWVTNGPLPGTEGKETCDTCSNCVVGQGIKDLQVKARSGTGFSQVAVSQAYADARCGESCVNEDGIYWTGMTYTCVEPTCKDVDLATEGAQKFTCSEGWTYDPKKGDNTNPSDETCCTFEPTCGAINPSGERYPCEAQGCLPEDPKYCWTFNEKSVNEPLTGNTAEDLLLCCNKPNPPESDPDVYVKKTTINNRRKPVGSKFNFLVEVGVQGLSDALARDVELTDNLPEGLILVEVEELYVPPENACGIQTAKQIKCTWPILRYGDKRIINVTVEGTTAGDWVNRAIVTTTSNDFNPDNNKDEDNVEVQGACCDEQNGVCRLATYRRDCPPPQTFYESNNCDTIRCGEVTGGACCLPLFGQCLDKADRASCQKEGGTWYSGRLCSEIREEGLCSPPVGACCNVKTGECREDVELLECELEWSTWKRDGKCTSDGYCSGSCCRVNKGDCYQAMKKDCPPDGIWSIYQQCNILTCPSNDKCIPKWWKCAPPIWGQADPCCPGYSCQYSYKGCAAGEFVCKPDKGGKHSKGGYSYKGKDKYKGGSQPYYPGGQDYCKPEYHSCGGNSDGVCCEGYQCQWDHYKNTGSCVKYYKDYCKSAGDKCSSDADCCLGNRCYLGKKGKGRCSPVTPDKCHRPCYDYECYEERKKDCNCLYAAAATL